MKQILTTLLLINSLSAMEKQVIQRKPREWNAQAYAEGNAMQNAANEYFFKSNNIQAKDLNILEVGCGTGEQAAQLSQIAKHIHAIDASKNMVEYAKKQYPHLKNVTFEHCFAEDFQPQKKYQLALASCCVHWFENKKQALQNINDSLEIDGLFFANITTANHPEPFTLVVFREMLQDIPIIGNWLSQCKNPSGQTAQPTHNELKTMLNETGFEIITCESQSFNWTANKEEVRKWLYPIITSTPAIQYIPETFVEPLFENFFHRCLDKLIKNDNGSYTWEYITEIVYARKIKDQA